MVSGSPPIHYAVSHGGARAGTRCSGRHPPRPPGRSRQAAGADRRPHRAHPRVGSGVLDSEKIFGFGLGDTYPL